MSPAKAAMPKLEGGDISTTHNLVVGIYTSTYTVRTWVLDLREIRTLAICFRSGDRVQRAQGWL